MCFMYVDFARKVDFNNVFVEADMLCNFLTAIITIAHLLPTEFIVMITISGPYIFTIACFLPT